ncbi:acyl-protein synthetase [Flammeovirgaceae bacterium 311]|nr:acyl-protein synthetase [Flammeovirgaceae bacterium 311]
MMQQFDPTLPQRILSLEPNGFELLALEVFRLQAQHNSVYRQFLECLHCKPESVVKIADIPFLPIEFFKRHQVKTGEWQPQAVFESSGTGMGARSRHVVPSLDFYLKVTSHIFEAAYGPLKDFIVLALLPSYLERQHSSLVLMAQHFMELSGHALSGFYLYEHTDLIAAVEESLHTGKKVLLLGVSFALLDLAELGPFNWQNLMVMETGGMKGRRQELIREELHEKLCNAFGVSYIHSEYGMTELLSQAYAKQNGVFIAPPWMQVYIREVNDPFKQIGAGHTGGINIIDLANYSSCSFIETADLGLMHENGTFEVLGRFDNSEARGCNLMLYS